ncbi:MAG TPA: DNA gyrase/topoisomerase IV subunit A, partial [Phnomibacter sp.]|nr:DNA gyrase/topoisomerase IV subunit A [Phnomibacter sp.]
FEGDDKLLVIYTDGSYEITDQELTQRFEPEQVLLIERFTPSKIITAIYYDADKMQYNIKRFKIETQTLRTRFVFIKEGKDNYLEMVTTEAEPVLVMRTGKGATAEHRQLKVTQLVDVMGWKAVGSKLVDKKAVEMDWLTADNKGIQPELF